MRSLFRSGFRRLAGFGRCRCGGVALIFALLLPVLSVAAVAGVQLSYVANARSEAQDAADQAALAGAAQMTLGPEAVERARQLAVAQLAHDGSPSSFRVSASTPDKSTMHVAVDIYTPSFFGDLLPRGGFRGRVDSVAEQQSRSPLCVLSSDGAKALTLTETAQLSGPCVIHSNGDIQAAKGTQLVGQRVEATGKAVGAISPLPRPGAPRVEDPLTTMDLTPPGPCGVPVDHVYNTGDVIPAGVLNENIIVNNNNMPTLAPGAHYICGKFTIWVNATVSGSNTAIIMTRTSSWDMHTNAHIIITGLQTGTLAGLVLGVTPDQSGDYMLPTNPFDTITGVIYAPSVNLKLYGSKAAGELSDWTIVVAKGLAITQAANLQIRTNYKSSPTPVPAGVGDHISQVAIVR